MYRISRIALALLTFGCLLMAQQPQKIKINYPARTGTTWPLYIAKDGGYYAKYGLDVDLVFGVHPAGIAMVVSGEAVMTNYTLEQAMQAASKDGSLIAYASSFQEELVRADDERRAERSRSEGETHRSQPDRRCAI